MGNTNSSRIQEIQNFLPSDTKVIWDLCCDHGKIGIQFLNLHYKVHFLDQVKLITKKLDITLKATDIPKGSYNIHTEDISKFNFPVSKDKTFYIFVGIGADLIIKTLDNFNLTNNDYFLLCAHQNGHKLRSFLKEKNIKVIQEKLLHENNQSYEFILVHKNEGKKCSLVGVDLWGNDLKTQEYLEKQINLFEIKSRFDDKFEQIHQEYLQVKKTLNNIK